MDLAKPKLQPLGDKAILVRFADRLDDAANKLAISFARALRDADLPGVEEVVSSLVSVLVRYEPKEVSFAALTGELRLHLSSFKGLGAADEGAHHEVRISFGGEAGPDLDEVAAELKLSPEDFIKEHNAKMLRVMAVGFAPGFVYCGMHDEKLHLPRRQQVRPLVPAGAVLFAAGQTAIAATPMPTGWHVIGQTDLRNFDVSKDPAVTLDAGDSVRFEVAN